MITIFQIILESISSLIKGIDIFLQSKDLTLGAILALVAPFIVLWMKISNEKGKKAKQLLIERRQMQIAFNVNEIMEKLGVDTKWNLQEIGSTHTVPQMRKKLLSYLPKLSIQKRRMIMEKLKSRKLWLAIFGALFPVLNVEFGINLDPNVVFAVLGVVVSGIAGLAHVDGKKAQAVVTALKETVPIDPNATYKDMSPTIKEAHDKINKFLKLAKTNDVNVLAMYPKLNELLTSYEHPEPVAVIIEDKVIA